MQLHDVTPELVRRGVESVRKNLEQGIAKGKTTPEQRDTILSRIHPAPDLEEAAREVDLAIEAVPESMDLKKEVFRRLGASARQSAILATNTSALPVREIARAASAPERVVGMHFFNPVVMPLTGRADRGGVG